MYYCNRECQTIVGGFDPETDAEVIISTIEEMLTEGREELKWLR